MGIYDDCVVEHATWEYNYDDESEQFLQKFIYFQKFKLIVN